MDRRRLFMLLAPGLFVLASFSLTRWMRPPTPPAWSPNVVDTTQVNFASEVAPLSVSAASQTALDTACRERAQELSLALGGSFNVWVSTPFVLVGDVSEETLQRIYRRTVMPASRAMQSEYFERRPDAPVALLLCSSAEAYEQAARELFGDQYVSVYGYYRPRERMVIVNLTTGSGTLVHELTHALMHFDFPDAPAWLQEGLASLHEHGEFVEVDGRWLLRGRVNWRLHDLPRAPEESWPLGELLERDDLRGDQEAQWYALARYLCLFLQERRALTDVYREMREQAADREWPPSVLGSAPSSDRRSDRETTLSSQGSVALLLNAFGAADLKSVELRFRNWVDQLPSNTAWESPDLRLR